MNNENFLIEESDITLSRELCNEITDSKKRNRAIANALGSEIAKKYFTELEVDTNSGLHTIPIVTKELDIADIYINNAYIDVRVYFNDEQILVPKSHFEKDLLPIAYMFIKLDEEISSALVTGFITPELINKDSSEGNYYLVNEEDLESYYSIQDLLTSSFDEDYPEDFESNIFDYLDNRLKNVDDFYRVLLASKYLREFLKDAAKAQNILKDISLEQIEPEQETDSQHIQEDLSENIEETIDLGDVDIDLANLEESEDIKIYDSDEEAIDLGDVDIDLANLEESEDIKVDDSDEETIDLGDVDIDLVNLEESEDIKVDDSDEETIVLDEVSDLEDSEILEEVDGVDDSIEAEISDLMFNEDSEEDITVTDDTTVENELDNNSLDEVSLDIENNNSVEENLIDNDYESSFSTYENEDFSTSTTPSMESIENALSETEELEEAECFEDTEDIEETTDVDTTKQNELDTLFASEEYESPSEETQDISSEEIEDSEFSNVENSEEAEMLTFEEDDYKDEKDNDELDIEEYTEEDIQSLAEESDTVDKTSQLDNLFDDVPEETEASNVSEETYDYPEETSDEDFIPKKKNFSHIALICVLISGLAFGGYKLAKHFSGANNLNNTQNVTQENFQTTEQNAENAEAMPIETVENIDSAKTTNEGNAISIPKIEQNLDATILVENLNVKWEIPSTYVSNIAAEKYFLKMGKIIQLNLKTELLLLSKPPITNKIILELEYNKNAKKFNVKNVATSSGEKTVDDLIVRTVENSLDINLRTNMDIFKDLAGNPALVIRL